MGVKVDFSEIEALRDRFQALNTVKKRAFLEWLVNTLLARHLARTVKGTPVITGTLRRSWQVTPARFQGSTCVGHLYNSMEYSVYVENGHRTRGGKGWVKGRFMLAKSLGQVKKDLVRIGKPALEELLKEALHGK